jgi:hypothetical protein
MVQRSRGSRKKNPEPKSKKKSPDNPGIGPSETRDEAQSIHQVQVTAEGSSNQPITQFPEKSVPGTTNPTILVGADVSLPSNAARLTEYIIAPGGPLLAQWDNSLLPSNLGTFFEPQGELASELAEQRAPQQQDFAIPVVVGGWTPAGAQDVGDEDEEEEELGMERRSGGGSEMATTRAGMKRKAVSDSAFITPTSEVGPSTAKRVSKRDEEMSQSTSRRISKQPAVIGGVPEPSPTPATEDTSGENVEGVGDGGPSSSKAGGIRIEAGRPSSSSRLGDLTARFNPVLPVGNVYPIRIGAQLFRLSGGSISSDGAWTLDVYIDELT